VTPQDAVLSEEYVQARRVLLDALEALGEQRGAVVVAGAQAIYLRGGAGELAIADFTTDGDLAVDPALLKDAPPLGELMAAAGFTLAEFQGALEPGIWEAPAIVNGVEVMIPVDLIVPEGVASPTGTRGARLGPHGKRAARKTLGLEAALVDNGPMRISALDPADKRTSKVRVAGIAALLVAKAHKLNDRVESNRSDRLVDKDASDVVRLMQASSAETVAKTLAGLSKHPTAGPPTVLAIQHLGTLFGRRGGAGIEMAVRALRVAMPAERVSAICLAYTERLRTTLTEME
jgi:hypothetical protein